MVEGITPAVERGLDVHSLLSGPKEDLDFPTATVKFTRFAHAQFAGR